MTITQPFPLFTRVQDRFGGMRDDAKNRGGNCGIRKIFKEGCEIKTQRRDREMRHFKSGVQDRMATCEIVGESQQDLKIHERINFLDICPRENNIGSNMELTWLPGGIGMIMLGRDAGLKKPRLDPIFTNSVVCRVTCTIA